MQINMLFSEFIVTLIAVRLKLLLQILQTPGLDAPKESKTYAQKRTKKFVLLLIIMYNDTDINFMKESSMNKNNQKKNAGALIGAAFLMATSAIGPGFLTQTGKFTDSLHGSFGFVILISIVLAAIVQLNVWRVLCVSGMRGQDVANKVLPGLGYLVAFLVVAGGLVFNIGNVGGGALGFNALLGIPTTVGYFLAGAIAVVVFLSKNALKAMDTLTKVLGGLMIAVIFVVILIVRPPVGYALKETVAHR